MTRVRCLLVRAVVEGYHGENGPCGICGQPAWMHEGEPLRVPDDPPYDDACEEGDV